MTNEKHFGADAAEGDEGMSLSADTVAPHADPITVEERNMIYERTGGGEAYGLECERLIQSRIGRQALCDLEELRARFPGF